jgi:hypothetical protein
MTVGNVRQWLDQSNIDFFTHFVKAWIPFNAWFRDSYGATVTERDILEKVKSDGNRMRSRVMVQLTTTGAEGERLRNHIAGLHRNLSSDPLEDRQKRRIALERVCIGRNPASHAERVSYGSTYRVERQHGASPEVRCTVTSPTGAVSAALTIDGPWDVEALQIDSEFQKLSTRKQSILLACFRDVNPFLFRNLLADAGEHDVIMMDDYRFVNDCSAIFAGLVDVLYEMRNLLFHGELVPDPRANATYEPGYYLLRHFLRAVS